jgi:hypothetical protein
MVKGTKLTSTTYAKTLKRLKQCSNSIHWGKKPILLEHDNAGPHTHAATSAATDSTGYEVFPHTSYSLNLAPSVFRLFATLKVHINAIQFTCEDKVHAAMEKWFQEWPQEFYGDSFEKLVQQ